MASTSPLPASALAASRAALNSALNEVADSESIQDKPASSISIDTSPATIAPKADGEATPQSAQELNMEAQAEEIRTVFNDPERFNVKVGGGIRRPRIVNSSHNSTLCSPRGRCGSTPPLQKAAICPRLPVLHSPKHLQPPIQPHRAQEDGWTT
jgi:hypothetical protein